MEAINITAYTNDASQIKAIKAVMKALKIKFEITKDEKNKTISANNEITNPAILESIEAYEKKTIKPTPLNLADIKKITHA